MYCTNHPDYYGECGNQNWHWRTPVQWAYQYEQSANARFSDVVPSNGGLSDALRQKLAEEDLADMEVLLRYRGIRTLHALESLEPTERVVLLCKARLFYELLEVFPSHKKIALNKLFGDVPHQGVLFVWGDMVTTLPDCGKLQERLFAWEMARNKLTHVMLLVQHSYTVCALYRRAMPSSSQDFRCCMFIAMLARQNMSMEIVVVFGTVIRVIDLATPS